MKTISLTVLALVSVAANAETVDQRSSDITVLKAFSTGKYIGGDSFRIDLSKCTQISGSKTDDLVFDCTSMVESTMATLYPEISAPLAREVIIHAYRYNGNLSMSDFRCRALEVQTISRRGAVNAASGVGFYFNDSIRTIPADKLVKIGEATLKDGSAADIHRFQAPAFCWQGSMSSSTMASYRFRPFMEFASSDGRLFRNWDAVESDYAVGRVGGYQGIWIEGFDRSIELLK